MTFKELRSQTEFNQTQFANYFNIPLRTVQNWEGGVRQPPEYLMDLFIYKLRNEGLLANTETLGDKE
jgi:DNA-binding transcriptional regulator YiaG